MYKALKGRQIITYNGVFKESAKLYKKGDLDYLKDVDLTEYVYRILYQWGQGEYVEKEMRELTDEEIYCLASISSFSRSLRFTCDNSHEIGRANKSANIFLPSETVFVWQQSSFRHFSSSRRRRAEPEGFD